MNNIIKSRHPLNILKNLDTLGREGDLFGGMLDDLFHFHGFSPFKGINNPNFSPLLDLVETEKEYVIKAEIPGLDKKNIDVEIDNNTLILKGEKKFEKEEENEESYVCERCYGTFRREIALPENCNEGKIEGTYENGVLKLTLPKIEVKEKEKKKILIKS